MFCAPGYFSDMKEMDATHALSARATVSDMRQEQGSLGQLLRTEVRGWMHGDLGESRQFQTPVSSLLRARGLSSARLLLTGVLAGWLAALLVAIPFSLRRGVGADFVLAAVTAALLAVPVGAMATLCLIANWNRPVLILALVVAVRDAKLLHRVLALTWQAPYVVHARAQGLSTLQILRTHVVPVLQREFLAVGVMSFTLALSALVPVEVIFDVSGVGQLAWNAALNRDLPVLVAVTGLMAACVGVANLILGPTARFEEATCA